MANERQKIKKRLKRLEAKYEKNPKAFIRQARIEKTAKRLIRKLDNMREKFEKFLEDNGVKEAWKRNNTIPGDYGIFSVDPSRWLLLSFGWYETPEGHEFWYTLHKRWFDICDREYIKDTFVRFLAERGAYRAFMYNLGYCPSGSYNWDEHSKELPEYWISFGFEWDYSNEGFDFWDNLCTEWEEIYAELQ